MTAIQHSCNHIWKIPLQLFFSLLDHKSAFWMFFPLVKSFKHIEFREQLWLGSVQTFNVYFVFILLLRINRLIFILNIQSTLVEYFIFKQQTGVRNVPKEGTDPRVPERTRLVADPSDLTRQTRWQQQNVSFILSAKLYVVISALVIQLFICHRDALWQTWYLSYRWLNGGGCLYAYCVFSANF